jgi:predicted glycosyltransferase
MSRLSVFFYVQHLLGIGHLARASRVASALRARGMAVTLVTGGPPVAGFPGADVDHVALPPVSVGDGSFSGLMDASGNPATPAYLDQRRDLLLEAFDRVRPDIVVTEAFPFGRRQMRFELLPLIRAIEARKPRPLLVASIRDILQRSSKPGRSEETVDLVLAHFDRVLVHGDPAFAALEDSFPLASRIAQKVSYTGLVCPPRPVPSPERFDMVVSVGGGAVGAILVRAAIEAARLRPDLARCCVIAGPNLPQSDYDSLAAAAPASVELCRFRTDFAALLASCRLSVSQAGYNTVADILQAGCRALLVPFASDGETEQTERARRLEGAGRMVMLAESDLARPETAGAAMADAIGRALALPLDASRQPAAADGANRSAEILEDLARGHHAAITG